MESVYEPYLRGERGKQKLIVNADGETIQALGTIPPTPGDDLALALDARVQRLAEKALAEGMVHARTYHDQTAVLSGERGRRRRARCEHRRRRRDGFEPRLRPSWYVHGLTPQQQKYLTKNANAPSVNRATQLTYQPGSTFKSITGLTAIKEGFATMSGYYPCDGTYTKPATVGNCVQQLDGHEPRWDDHQPCVGRLVRHGVRCVRRRLLRSVRAELARDARRPPERDLHDWGFESPTGVDLPAEATGLVPDPAWAETARAADGSRLFPYGWVPGGDILTMIGSGYVQVTPLQLAQAYAAIANGGHLCRPHLVDQILAPDGSTAKRVDSRCDRTIPYSPQELGYIRGALRGVVSTGGPPRAPSPGSRPRRSPWPARPGPPNGPVPGHVVVRLDGGSRPRPPEYVIVTMVEQGASAGRPPRPSRVR